MLDETNTVAAVSAFFMINPLKIDVVRLTAIEHRALLIFSIAQGCNMLLSGPAAAPVQGQLSQGKILVPGLSEFISVAVDPY